MDQHFKFHLHKQITLTLSFYVASFPVKMEFSKWTFRKVRITLKGRFRYYHIIEQLTKKRDFSRFTLITFICRRILNGFPSVHYKRGARKVQEGYENDNKKVFPFRASRSTIITLLV